MSITELKAPDGRWHPRDIIAAGMFLLNLVGIIVAATVYFTGGFNRSDITSRDVQEIRQTLASLGANQHDMDINGTRHSSQIDALQQQEINQNTENIKELQKNYAALYEIMNEVKTNVSMLVDGKKK